VGQTLSGGAVSHAASGEAGLGYSFADGGVGVRLFRRGNEESLLALSGSLDASTGIRWGRVLERGVALNAYHKDDSWDKMGSLVISISSFVISWAESGFDAMVVEDWEMG